jgi:hypothetical protein
MNARRFSVESQEVAAGRKWSESDWKDHKWSHYVAMHRKVIRTVLKVKEEVFCAQGAMRLYQRVFGDVRRCSCVSIHVRTCSYIIGDSCRDRGWRGE